MNNEITDLQQDIDLADALKRLKENKDFQKLIEELYLDGGAIQLTKNFVLVNDRESLVEQYTARSWLYRFLYEIEDNGITAIEALKDLNNEGE